MTCYVQLDRSFALLQRNKTNEYFEYHSDFIYSEKISGESLFLEARAVILAEAGAGKTTEFEQYAKGLQEQGLFSFFIRIEDIDRNFIESFEVGDEDVFEEWLESTENAYFFLDSVDEARLKDSRQFEKAIKIFSKKIKAGAHRCHVYISSRPYSWRFREDERLLNEELFLAPNKSTEQLTQDEQVKSSLKVFTLCPLNISQIQEFCLVRSVENIDDFLNEIQKYNLTSLAERPFDLENLIVKWNENNVLGSRTDVIKYNIYSRLLDRHTQFKYPVEISRDKLEEGAQRIASMLTLTGKSNIKVPSSENNHDYIDASEILSEWDSSEIDRLVNSAIFNDVVYGAVRFRHRSIREFLSAQWFLKLLKSDNCLYIEGLFIREQFGEKIIIPLLRPILPWLIPYDEQLRSKVLQIQPEIAFEGGDFFQLSLNDRGQFLEGVVERISSAQGYHAMLHNDDIARVASKDLEDKTDSLIQKYSSESGVIFFLARLVWMGNMTRCLQSLLSIALKTNNDVHTISICVRAIMCCGNRSEQILLWKELNNAPVTLDHIVLVELVGHVKPDTEIIQLLLISLENTNQPDEYKPSGLIEVLAKFIEQCDENLLFEFLKGLSELLFTEPFYKYEYCYISEKYAWLMRTSLQIMLHLIKVKSAYIFDQQIIVILFHVRALDFKREITESYDYSISDEKKELKQVISQWSELNDQLYWSSIDIVRNDQTSITDDRQISWMGHFWDFGIHDFDRLIAFIDSKPLMDDKTISFSRAFRVYSQNSKPKWMLVQLEQVSNKYPILSDRLNIWLNPALMEQSEETKLLEEQFAAQKRELDEINRQEKLARIEWIKSLRDDPNQLSGELTDNHIKLMYECKVHPTVHTSWGTKYINWEILASEFGEEIAHKYYDAIIKFWRMYKPAIHSEGHIEKGSIPNKLIFGLTGLEVESRKNSNFPKYLSEEEVENALRYVTWEMNGFPTWFERMYKVFPDETIFAIMKEVRWAIQNSEDNFLNHLLYSASWLHVDLASQILSYLLENQIVLLGNTLKYTLGVLLNGDINAEQFSALARTMLMKGKIEDQAVWYALLVDSDPENGISLLENWLSKLQKEEAEIATQTFIIHLFNKSRVEKFAINGRAGQGVIKKAKYLQKIYLIVHRYIKIEDDIDRSNGGVYSPTLRDNAQDSRYLIFQYLKEISSSESYHAIKELANQESDQGRAIWMHQVAYNIAVSCGNLDSFSIDKVLELEKFGEINPTTHKELFYLALLKINNLKYWLENGDTSPFLTWQKAENETEMRILIAGQLDKESQGKYTISQEYEVANGQRPDIRFDKPNITSVPVELKVLDKKWSGRDLCERLRNQLIGDYLREETASCGIFLLVAQNVEKKWTINGKRVSVNELEKALQDYWQSIAHEWPKIDSIKVLVINLNKRSLVSST